VITVEARTTEDVKAWMDKAATVASRDHDNRSPQCRIDELSELMIPVEGAEMIGGPVTEKPNDKIV
jgi:hypothetical protein